MSASGSQSHRPRRLLAGKHIFAVQHGCRAHDVEREGASDNRVGITDDQGEVGLFARSTEPSISPCAGKAQEYIV